MSVSSNGRNGNAAPRKPCLRVIPLGGLHEIGKNTCVFEYGDDIMLVDAGLAFPSDGMHGVNVVMPDTSYLKENQKRIRGMIVTHGHEDHIGGIAHHLKNFNIPVIHGPRLALAMLTGKMEEAGVMDRTILQTVAPRDVVKVGQHFSVEFIRNTHSMADSFSLAITTPVGTVIFTGDFKFDPLGFGKQDMKTMQLKEIKNGRLAMLAIGGIVHHFFLTGKGPLELLTNFKVGA